MTEETKKSRSVHGRVISNKTDKTITVRVERMEPHELYRKYVRRSSKLRAHDANNECQTGDWVAIEECRPVSKTKTWRVVKVLERAR